MKMLYLQLRATIMIRQMIGEETGAETRPASYLSDRLTSYYRIQASFLYIGVLLVRHESNPHVSAWSEQ